MIMATRYYKTLICKNADNSVSEEIPTVPYELLGSGNYNYATV